MEKKLFFTRFLLLIAFVWITTSCHTQKKVVQQPAPPLQTVAKPNLAPWTQDLDLNLQAGDPILFYNQYKIVVEGMIPVQIISFVDGRRMVNDTSIIYNYSVPAETKGKLKKVIYKNGKPSIVDVMLDNTADSMNYVHTFYVQPNKEFLLGSKINIKVEGVTYPVSVAIDGDGSGKDRLMHDPGYNNNQRNVGKVASGVGGVIGTKIIKK